MFKRGYKTWCENISLSFRKELGLEKNAPLSPFDLAEHLSVKVVTPYDIDDLAQKDKDILLGDASSSWSAVTIYAGESELIIYNPTHHPRRNSNTLMHELSHIIVGHESSQTLYSAETGIALRNYVKDNEDEADWLAGTLLLPKEALVSIKWSKMTTEEACNKYLVSKDLLNMRLNKTGVNQIYKKTQSR